MLKSYDDLSGIAKSAVLLLALDSEAAGLILKQLAPGPVEAVNRELASLGVISEQLRDKVLDEFYGLVMTQPWANGDRRDYARDLLRGSLDLKGADRSVETVGQQPFRFLQKAETQHLLAVIRDEHPQTIALVVSHMAYHKAAEILGGLPALKQVEVVKRVANMQQINPDIVSEVADDLEARLGNMQRQLAKNVGGAELGHDMLNRGDRTPREGILEDLEREESDLGKQIRCRTFVFEDFMFVTDKGIRSVLKQIDNDELAVALKTASNDLKEKVFANMSEHAAALVKEEMELVGPVRISDVEMAQQRIIALMSRIENAGQTIIAGRDSENETNVWHADPQEPRSGRFYG